MVERVNMQCPECGGEIVLSKDKKYGKCSSCDNEFNYRCEKSAEKISLFNHANLLRMRGDFEGALIAYQSLLEIDNTDAEIYWGIVLSTYGIEYVLDPRTNRHLPTCRRIVERSIYLDKNYKLALELSEDEQKNKYQKEAVLINKLQSDIKERLALEAAYDVFICFKSTDESGFMTEDRYVGRRIYDELTKRGIRTFFSEVTLKDKLGKDFEPIIYKALYSAKVMILVATKEEYINSVWLKSEWARFRDRVHEENLKDASFAVFKNLPPDALPPLFRSQGVDLAKYPFGGYEIEIADALSLRLKNSTGNSFNTNNNGNNSNASFNSNINNNGNSSNASFNSNANNNGNNSNSSFNSNGNYSDDAFYGTGAKRTASRIQTNLTRNQVNKELSILVRERNHYIKMRERAESEQNVTKSAMKRTAERRKIFALEQERLDKILANPNYRKNIIKKKRAGRILICILFTILLIALASAYVSNVAFRAILILVGLSIIWSGHLGRRKHKKLEKKRLIDTEREAQLREQIIQCETHLAGQNRKLEKCAYDINEAQLKLRERDELLNEYVKVYDYAALQIEKINSSIGQKVAVAISEGVMELSSGIDKGINAVKDAFKKG